MGKSLSYAVGICLFLGCFEKNNERSLDETLDRIVESTPTLQYIDPFDESIPKVSYEDLTEDEKKKFDEFRNRRGPGDVPGLRKMIEIYYPYYDGKTVDPGTMMFYNGKFISLK